MAGHSKWANIRFRKGAQDARRGKLFTKLIREITISTRETGPDPASNPRLRAAIDKAYANNMSRDTVERAIKRGSGDMDGASYEQLRYEGYGPGGVAVIVDCLTDNRQRTVADVRHAFAKNGGNLGTDGSVAYLFSAQGVLYYPADSDEDAIMEAAIEAGAQDVATNDDGSIEVITAPEQFHAVLDAMNAAGLVPDESEQTMRAATAVAVDGEQAPALLRMLEMLEDLDDVQNVYSNAEFDEAALAETA
ncbi:MAG: YebC/PmpR family DNA-binding transcriptional regulator [Chromatiales bacterium]|nr:YebC/PmpR family DNA-binding transcriptional regulator [Chromatiales bacterium]